jgi:hypothetical protein
MLIRSLGDLAPGSDRPRSHRRPDRAFANRTFPNRAFPNRAFADWGLTDRGFADQRQTGHGRRWRRLTDREIGRDGGTRNPED